VAEFKAKHSAVIAEAAAADQGDAGGDAPEKQKSAPREKASSSTEPVLPAKRPASDEPAMAVKTPRRRRK